MNPWRAKDDCSGAATEAVAAAYMEAGYENLVPDAGPPDHIGTELRFMSVLCFREMEAWRDGDESAARNVLERELEFLDEHISQWIPQLCDRLAESTTQAYYLAVATLTAARLPPGSTRGRGVCRWRLLVFWLGSACYGRTAARLRGPAHVRFPPTRTQWRSRRDLPLAWRRAGGGRRHRCARACTRSCAAHESGGIRAGPSGRRPGAAKPRRRWRPYRVRNRPSRLLPCACRHGRR